MSLKDIYQRFLADSKSAPLAANVSLIYITTTTQIDGADAVVSHLTKQESIVKRKSAEIIGAIECSDSLCLDVETTLEFVSGGGAYLPSLDDNFLADRVASFPTVHVVRFNSEKQIQNVRIYWDQASLLKQVEVIGSRGRGWPIRDAKDQARLIKAAVTSTPASNGPAPSPPDSTKENVESTSKVASPGKKHIKDPYAAGSLEELLSPGKDRAEPVRAPRTPASAQPPPREYSELFIGDDDVDEPDATPSKSRVIAPKAGAGKNFRPSRIFGGDEETDAAGAKQQIAYKANPKRFDCFEIGADNSELEVKTKPVRPSRPVSHWNFEDFTTPEKPKRQLRNQEIRHFGWGDGESELQNTPPVRPHVAQPRRDAETHFELADNDGENKSRIISSFQNKGLNLYKNPLYNEEDSPVKKGENKAPVSVAHNGVNRKKDFESHWSMADSPPKVNHENQKPMPAGRLKSVKMMEPSWESYDESPQPSRTAPPPPQRRAGRNVNERHFAFGNEE